MRLKNLKLACIKKKVFFCFYVIHLCQPAVYFLPLRCGRHILSYICFDRNRRSQESLEEREPLISSLGINQPAMYKSVNVSPIGLLCDSSTGAQGLMTSFHSVDTNTGTLVCSMLVFCCMFFLLHECTKYKISYSKTSIQFSNSQIRIVHW